jgi:hypothetical protein
MLDVINLSGHEDYLRTLYGTWRTVSALNTAIRLGEGVCSTLDTEIRDERRRAEDKLKELLTQDSVLSNKLKISTHTPRYIDLLKEYIPLITRLETIAHSVYSRYFYIRSKNKDKSLEEYFIVDIVEYITLVTEIKDIEQQMEEILDQIAEDTRPVLSYDEAIEQFYRNNYNEDKNDDEDNNDDDD